MAKYSFICSEYSHKEVIFTSSDTLTKVCKKCGSTSHRQLPIISGPASVKEVIDKYTNVALPPDNDEILQSRKLDYFWKHEVPRLVQEHDLETCLSNGWMGFDEQNKLITYDKPPGRR